MPILLYLIIFVRRIIKKIFRSNKIFIRSLFIIDSNRILRQIITNDPSLLFDLDEVLRYVQAYQHVDEYGDCKLPILLDCPANWKMGDKALNTSKAEDFISNTYFKY